MAGYVVLSISFGGRAPTAMIRRRRGFVEWMLGAPRPHAYPIVYRLGWWCRSPYGTDPVSFDEYKAVKRYLEDHIHRLRDGGGDAKDFIALLEELLRTEHAR